MVDTAAVGAVERRCGCATVTRFKCVLGAIEGAAAAQVGIIGERPVCTTALTAAGEPWPLWCGSVVVASPVYTLDALVPVDDLEDLTDERTGFLSGILVQGQEESSGSYLPPPPGHAYVLRCSVSRC